MNIIRHPRAPITVQEALDRVRNIIDDVESVVIIEHRKGSGQTHAHWTRQSAGMLSAAAVLLNAEAARVLLTGEDGDDDGQ